MVVELLLLHLEIEGIPRKDCHNWFKYVWSKAYDTCVAPQIVVPPQNVDDNLCNTSHHKLSSLAQIVVDDNLCREVAPQIVVYHRIT